MKIQNIEAAEKYVFRRSLTAKERKEWESMLEDLIGTGKNCRCMENDKMYLDYYPPELYHQFTSNWLNGIGIPLKIHSYYFLLIPVAV